MRKATCLWVPEELGARLEAQSEKHHVPCSTLMRILIERGLVEVEAADYLEFPKKDPPPRYRKPKPPKPRRRKNQSISRKALEEAKRRFLEKPFPSLEEILAAVFWKHESVGGKVVQVQLPFKEHLVELGAPKGGIGDWGGAEIVQGPCLLIVRGPSGRLFEYPFEIPPQLHYWGIKLERDALVAG